MRAFIIRPFGTQRDIDFDRVEQELIDPALAELGVAGRTTIEILKQGNIRTDMFQRLLTADLVIADISIHNANVFYELGVRHALRDKRTFLIRSKGDDVPFDIRTDRYFSYERDNPAADAKKPDDPRAGLKNFVQALRRTIDSEDRDSPVFQLLPDLEAQEQSRFLIVPLDFREEVERAADNKQAGDLELLAEEAHGFQWEMGGLRVVGREQFNLRAYEGARETWEAVRDFNPNDIEANRLLGTIYQRLGDLSRSDQAVDRVLKRKGLSGRDRAEFYSLLASNAKTQWKDAWSKDPASSSREHALRSAQLLKGYELYAQGFNEDLNHFYAGLNAVAMLTVTIELAQALPDVWAERFETPEEGERELSSLKEQLRKLSASAELSLKATKARLKREERIDHWVEVSAADFCCLTSKSPGRVANEYRNALAGVEDFDADAARRQLVIYERLGVLPQNTQAALEIIGQSAATPKEKPERVLLFTGHMIDAPDRKKPRFPAAKEPVARDKIKEKVGAELKLAGGLACGIAGGSNGGDILFHEVCQELGIRTELYLALPEEKYIATSVQAAGPEWVERFNRLCEHLPKRVLAESRELPRWLREKPDYGIWQRNNLWTLHNAVAQAGGKNVTLIALWDGEEGDGPGGTKDMVEKARERGAKTIIFDTKQLFGL